MAMHRRVYELLAYDDFDYMSIAHQLLLQADRGGDVAAYEALRPIVEGKITLDDIREQAHGEDLLRLRYGTREPESIRDWWTR